MNQGMALPVPEHQEAMPPEIEGIPAMTTDKLLDWLERKDGPVALWLGYGLCMITFIYLVAQVIKAMV